SLTQNHDADNSSNSHNLKLGMDWYLNPKTTVSVNGVYSNRFRGGGGLSRFEYFDQEGVIESLEFQDEIDRNESNSWNANLRFEKQFSSREHNLFFDSRYSQNERFDREINYFRDAHLDGSAGSATDIIRVLTENQDRSTTVLEAGYAHPHMVDVGGKKQEKWKIETGLKAILKATETDFVSASTDTLTSTIINEEGTSNVFKLTENILSAYGTYRQRWGVWGAQLGLRAEAALTNPELLTTGEVFDNDYFSLFPTVHLSRKLDKEQELQLSYSRRINRAQHWALNPFIDRSNPLDIRIGNPDLQPEFVHKVEVGFVKTWEVGHTFSSSVYFTHTDDLITSFRTVNTEGITETTYQNFSWRRRVGLELISSLQFTDWWRGVISADIRRASVDASNIEVGLTNSNFEYALKANTNITMPWDMMMQISSNYRGPRVGPQGTFKGYITLNVSVRKDLWNKKASITLRASDLFDQRRFGMITDIPGLYQDSEFKRESRIGWLSFSYKFGKQQFDRKRSGRSGGGFEEDGGEEM
ncbi:MAG: iron complex outermembrane receptor protein, partial [Limisphaerales bacterium]